MGRAPDPDPDPDPNSDPLPLPLITPMSSAALPFPTDAASKVHAMSTNVLMLDKQLD